LPDELVISQLDTRQLLSKAFDALLFQLLLTFVVFVRDRFLHFADVQSLQSLFIRVKGELADGQFVVRAASGQKLVV